MLRIVKIFLILVLVINSRVCWANEAFPPARMAVTVPVQDYTAINNPFMGFAPRANETAAEPLNHTLVFAYLFWSEIEPQKGVYDFAAFEAKNQFAYWKSKGVKIIFRLVMDWPGDQKHMDIPAWLFNEMDGAGKWYQTEYGQGFSPDYSHPDLIAAHKKLIAELARRYNNDPFVAWIELGSVGHWGEWHVHTSINHGASAFPRAAIADQYVQPYIEGFCHKKLLMRRPMPIAVQNKLGLYNDGIGYTKYVYNCFIDWLDSGYTFNLTGEKMPPYPEYWQNAPCGGESIIRNEDFYGEEFIAEALQQIRDLKLTYFKARFYQPLDPVIMDNSLRFRNTLGYRFVIDQAYYPMQATAGQTVEMSIRISNVGCAPFYFKWPVNININDEAGNILVSYGTKFDLSSLYGGQTAKITETLIIPSTLKKGKYKLNISIIDPATKKSGVQFANIGRKYDGSFYFGYLTIR